MYETDVLIAGAGPTGLTLAVDLARRGVRFRLLDAATAPANGSRGKGLQPRTLELLDDLGVVDVFLRHGDTYPRFQVHAGPLAFSMAGLDPPTPPRDDVPYPSLWMVPQFRTEELLAERLAALGGSIERGRALASFVVDDDDDGGGGGGVTAETSDGERVRARYLVGCDGGHSAVRKLLGVGFQGERVDGPRAIVGDVVCRGLDRSRWHVWPLAKGCVLTLCPLPGSDRFQLAAPLSKKTEPPPLTLEGVRAFVARGSGGRAYVDELPWVSVVTPHVRMVERFLVGRVLLAGDAAHVHPPSGGQGLNTGVQDAYNLGWKLAAVVEGAPASLLDSYDAERRPVAEHVLGLSQRLLKNGSLKRGDETKQLGLSSRDSPLTRPSSTATLHAGDRAPDGKGIDGKGVARVFDRLRGPHFTALVFGAAHVAVSRARVVRVVGALVDARDDDIVDVSGSIARRYGARAGDVILVRPDGYIALIGSATDASTHLAETLGPASMGRRPR